LTYPILSYILGRWLGMAVNIYWAGPPAWNLIIICVRALAGLKLGHFRAGPP